MPADTLQKSSQYLFCPSCQGTGRSQKSECPTCSGRGVYYWTGKYLLYWGERVDDLHIVYRKTTLMVNNIIDFLLLFFGIIGALLGFIFYARPLNMTPFSIYLSFMENSKSIILLIFWFSIITDSFAIYRFKRRIQEIQKIPKNILNKQGVKPTILQWQDIAKIPQKNYLDIAPFFSQSSIEAIEKSFTLAQKYRHHRIDTLHLFIALITFPEVSSIFVRLATPFHKLREKLTHALAPFSVPEYQSPHFTRDFRKTLFEAFLYAQRTKENKVFLPHLLIACIKTSEIIYEILFDLDITLDKIINVSQWMRFYHQLIQRMKRIRSRASLRPKSGINRAMTAVATPYLDSFSDDLTSLAQAGYLEPCIGREKEIQEIFRIMEGGTRQNVVIVGPAGVGKRTIAHGIAQLMVANDVPPYFRDKRLVSLSISRLVSGVSASDAEQRLLVIMNEIVRSGNIILFIHEISHMVGISSGGGASIDLSGVLAESLSKGYVRVISTSTPDDYVRYIESQSPLGEVLEKVEIEEVSGNEAIQILEAKSGPIEFQHQVFFSYDAIESTVQLSGRYLHDRYLPEKAIEILEEAAVRVYQTKGAQATVSKEDIAQVISEKTGIPLTQLTEQESQKLLHLEDLIHQRMVNQEEAVKMVASAIRRARAEMRDTKRPIVNLLFLGPTGVGKTQLAKTVAQVYFGDESEMIRIDMSEYQDTLSIHRLIGSPPIGGSSGNTGYLTEKVRLHPYSLVLLDEIEKAHPDILNIFLQVMDDGRLTDALGRTIDFTNVILIFTSNAATPIIQKRVAEGVEIQRIKEEIIEDELQKYFRPEFLNRFDGIIIFRPLTKEHIFQIAKILIKEVTANLEKKGIYLNATDAAIRELADLGFDPEFGARPMRRVIQEKIDNVIAEYIIAGKVKRRDTIILDVGGRVEVIASKKL